MPHRDRYILAYDVAAPLPRSRALRTVRGFGLDTQLSVHECWFTPGERNEVWHSLIGGLDAATDRLLLLRLDPRSAVDRLGRSRLGGGATSPASSVIVD